MIFIKIYALPKFLSVLDMPRFEMCVKELLGKYTKKDPTDITVIFMNFIYNGKQGLDNAFFVETSIQGSMSGQEVYVAPYCKKAIEKVLRKRKMTTRKPGKIEMFPLHQTYHGTLPEDRKDADER